MAKPAGHLHKRTGIWHTAKMIRGHRRKWSTKTGDKATAERRARDHWQRVIAEEHALVDRQASRSAAPSLGEVIEVYRSQDVASPSAQTRRQNANMLRRVVEIGAGRYADTMSVSVLTGDLVRAFQAGRLAGITEPELRARAKFSANSMLTQARSVFRSRRVYVAAGYKVPDLSGFIEAERFRDVRIDSEFRPFTGAELAAISAAIEVARGASPGVFVAAVLMLYGGLRNSEVRRAQRDWLQERNGAWWVVVRVSKTGRGVRWVPMERRWWDAIRAAAGDLWILPMKTETDRRRVVERDLNRWLAAVCPGRLAYDLRRQAGSAVLDAQGIEAARDFLGHATSDTTRRWYASRLTALRPISMLAAGDQPRGLP